ncbi:MAG: hypothetical protein ACFFCV_20495 [Promethearchaeota archaeon]
MKIKYISILGLIFGIVLSFLPHFVLGGFLQITLENKKYNTTNNELYDTWSVHLDCIPRDITIDSNNSIYVVGDNISWDYSLKILKYDDAGVQLWNKQYEDFFIFNPIIKTDSQNNLYLTCSFSNQTSEYRRTLVKYNSSGNLQWQQTWEPEDLVYISDFDFDSEDNIFIYGFWESEDYTDHTLLIMKFNSSGYQLWNQTFEESSNNLNARCLEIDSDNNIIITGSSYEDDWVYWLRLYNSSGELKWFMNSSYESFELLKLDPEENLITMARTLDNITYESYLILYKLNKSGICIWNYTFESKFTNYLYYGGIPTSMMYQFNLEIDSLGDIYVASEVEIPNDSHFIDAIIFKINQTGNFDNYLTWGGPRDDYSMDIDTDTDNNLYLCSLDYLIKNPVSNGKSFYRTNLFYFFITLFGLFCFLSLVSLYFIIKPRARRILRK